MADSGYSIHVVGPGDTIQAIADVYGADWLEIAEVNGLSYPYINTEPESPDNSIPAGVATIGHTLLIPTGTLMFPVRSDNGQLDVEKYILGADLDIYGYMESEHHVIRIGDEGELLNDAGDGDMLLAEGMRNLRQQLVTRLGTPKGALLLHPDYGSNLLDYVGKPITRELLIDIKLCVQECILKDSRVRAVSNINVRSEGRSTLIDCIVHAIEPFGDFRLLAKAVGPASETEF